MPRQGGPVCRLVIRKDMHSPSRRAGTEQYALPGPFNALAATLQGKMPGDHPFLSCRHRANVAIAQFAIKDTLSIYLFASILKSKRAAGSTTMTHGWIATLLNRHPVFRLRTRSFREDISASDRALASIGVAARSRDEMIEAIRTASTFGGHEHAAWLITTIESSERGAAREGEGNGHL